MVHRNTYINAPATLEPTLQTRQRDDLFFAGQLSGVEGYTESAASGLLAGINAARIARGKNPEVASRTTAHGSLVHYISHSNPIGYQPSNIAFGLLPDLDPPIRNKRKRKEALVRRALTDIEVFAASTSGDVLQSSSPGETIPGEDESPPDQARGTRASHA
jgi:methylenetetrahydrofolate--tRNA-(uracil-5-)-methyltransferase